MSDLDVRPAFEGELGLVETLLKGASEWLASRGIDRWQYPPDRDRIAQGIGRRECFLAFRDGLAVATIQVDDYADPEFWQEGDRPDVAM
ncbi:hypothetical protein ABVG11_37210 [Streptomyces sp. HD1123-B1]|uniref:hypothetical protein n=1 Tax=Streptomyces huangiella TaxID=3228804 RepID=UPI003D7C8FF3